VVAAFRELENTDSWMAKRMAMAVVAACRGIKGAGSAGWWRLVVNEKVRT